MPCRGFEPMQFPQQVVELRWGSKSVIEHRVSHMSITDELLEERMKRATLRGPYVLFSRLLSCCVSSLACAAAS